jgi:hypothetical protein
MEIVLKHFQDCTVVTSVRWFKNGGNPAMATHKSNLPQTHLLEETIWKPLEGKTSNKLAKYIEVPNSAQNMAVGAISRHCAAVMLSKFSPRLKLILPVLHTAEGNILSCRRGDQNTDILSLLYWHQSEGVNRSTPVQWRSNVILISSKCNSKSLCLHLLNCSGFVQGLKKS